MFHLRAIVSTLHLYGPKPVGQKDQSLRQLRLSRTSDNLTPSKELRVNVRLIDEQSMSMRALPVMIECPHLLVLVVVGRIMNIRTLPTCGRKRFAAIVMFKFGFVTPIVWLGVQFSSWISRFAVGSLAQVSLNPLQIRGDSSVGRAYD